MTKKKTDVLGPRCGRRIVVGTDSVTTCAVFDDCKGTVVPVNEERTAWQCTGCGHITDGRIGFFKGIEGL